MRFLCTFTQLCTICVPLCLLLSVFLCYFAVEMKKTLLYISLLLLSMSGNVMAQQQMYICRGGLADAFELNAMARLEMEPDSFRIRQQPAYATEDVDSIVFRRPTLDIRELGWWGNLTDGQSLYKAQLRAEREEGTVSFDYDVLFVIEAQAGICQSVLCKLLFSEEWMTWEYYIDVPIGTGGGHQEYPYIYVKETATGPRRFETWVNTNGTILPVECTWELEDTMLWSDCTKLLAGRPIGDVQTIVEAWVHQPPKKIDNPNY